jgi:hypothetical protein
MCRVAGKSPDKALSGKSKGVGRASKESRKRRPGSFRPLTNRVEGTLHPAGIRVDPVHFRNGPFLQIRLQFTKGGLNVIRSGGSCAVHFLAAAAHG